MFGSKGFVFFTACALPTGSKIFDQTFISGTKTVSKDNVSMNGPLHVGGAGLLGVRPNSLPTQYTGNLPIGEPIAACHSSMGFFPSEVLSGNSMRSSAHDFPAHTDRLVGEDQCSSRSANRGLTGPNSSKNVLKIRAGASSGSISLSSIIKQGIISFPMMKVLLQAALTVLNIICWSMPLRNRQAISANSKLLQLANSFSGGIFLMLSLGHLVPHSIGAMMEHFSSAAGAAADRVAPQSPIELITMASTRTLHCVLLGFGLIFFIDKIAFNTANDEVDCTDSGVVGGNERENERRADGRIQQEVGKFSKVTGAIISSSDKTTGSGAGSVSSTKSTFSTSSSVNTATKSALVLCLAMSVHALIESASLGLAVDTTAAAIMTTSVALHQPAESLALIVAFLKTDMSSGMIALCLSLYSVVSLVGVSAGVLISSLASPFVESVVVALTAGTFMYVGATEVVGEEFDDEASATDKTQRFVAYLAGMAIIAAVVAYSED